MTKNNKNTFCESCGATDTEVADYYLEDSDGYLGYTTFCGDCIERIREQHIDDDLDLIPEGEYADA